MKALLLSILFATLIAFTPVTTPGETLINKRNVSSLMTEKRISPNRIQVNPGDRYSRLTVIKEVDPSHDNRRRILCRCDCGVEKVFFLSSIRTSFEAFYRDLGPKPSASHSIERSDSNGNYEKSNCYWATTTEQNRNKRGVVLDSEKAEQIRRLYQSGTKATQLAKEFNVSRRLISGIVTGNVWRDV